MLRPLLLVIGFWLALVPVLGQSKHGIRYRNAYFGIELQFPKNVGYTAYTSESLQFDPANPLELVGYMPADSSIQLITAKHFSLTMLKKELRLPDTTFLTAADFGYQTYEAARKNAGIGKYSNGAYTDFKGNKAFSFDVSKRLATYGMEVDAETGEPYLTKNGMEQPTSDTALGNGTHQVIYFSHRGRFFRILYKKNSKAAQHMITSFTFM